MIEIKNTTPNTSVNVPTKYEGVGGVPTQLSLRPGVSFEIVDVEMKAYAQGVKADVANYISKNILVVSQYNDIHSYPDRDHRPNYSDNCVQGPTPVLASACVPVILPIGGTTPPTLQKDLPDCNSCCVAISDRSSVEDGLHWDDEVSGLEVAIDAFINIRDFFSAHSVSLAYHPVAGAASAATDPTNLATLLTQLAVLVGEYNTHLAAVGVHVNNDTYNPMAVPVLVTLEDAVVALRDLTRFFNNHRLQSDIGTVTVLTPIAVLTDAY